MNFDVLIRNALVVLPDAVLPASIGIVDGKIVEIGNVNGTAVQEIDAGELHVFPGLIDPHVHFNEPGRTDWEGIATGSAALAAGGGTSFFDMPLNSSPPTLDGPSFDLKRIAAEASSRTDFALWGGLTPGNLDRMEELAERGVIGFKAFMSNSGIADFERADDLTLYRGMKVAAKLGLIVAVHAESEEMTSKLTAETRASNVAHSWAEYLDSRPVVAELEAISRAITLAADTGCRLHIVHVSSARGAEIVHRAATQSVADVTCETCPHYLQLTTEDLTTLGARAKCAPPLRSSAEVEDLWHALASGYFALIGSDHSPSPGSMKTGDDPFAMWGGIAGVQSTLSILLSHEPTLPLHRVASLIASGTAKRFRIAGKGRIAVGYDADLALVDLNGNFELKQDMLLDRHGLSPYVGRSFRGFVKRTLVRGHTVHLDGKSVGDFRGRLLKPAQTEAARA